MMNLKVIRRKLEPNLNTDNIIYSKSSIFLQQQTVSMHYLVVYQYYWFNTVAHGEQAFWLEHG